MSRTGVLVCGHGSRSAAAVAEFRAAADQLRAHFPDWPLEHGYLEFADPVLRVGLDRLRDRGCDHILAVPGMLFAAGHAKNDIPSVLNAYAAQTGIRVQYGRELGVDPKMIAAAADRIAAAIARADADHGAVALHDTCLVVIGRGASDPDANSNVAKIARMLWEGMGFGWAETGFSGVTFPLVEPCLERAARLGFRRIVVFPYFLFTGILIDRIHGFTAMVAAATPGVQFVTAGYLGDHRLVIETFAERVREILVGTNLMNCAMCKYRAQVLGFEADQGAPQASHHHHVEGQGASAPGSNVADCALCDTFCTGACRLMSLDAARAAGPRTLAFAGVVAGAAPGTLGGGGVPTPVAHATPGTVAHATPGTVAHATPGTLAPATLGTAHSHTHAPGAAHTHPHPHADHPLGPESVRRHLKPPR